MGVKGSHDMKDTYITMTQIQSEKVLKRVVMSMTNLDISRGMDTKW